jgi:hypothetical protein
MASVISNIYFCIIYVIHHDFYDYVIRKYNDFYYNN